MLNLADLNLETQQDTIAKTRDHWNREFEKNCDSLSKKGAEEIVKTALETFQKSYTAYSETPTKQRPIRKTFQIPSWPCSKSDVDSLIHTTLEPFATWQKAEVEKEERFVLSSVVVEEKVEAGYLDGKYFREKTDTTIKKIEELVRNQLTKIAEKPGNQRLAFEVETSFLEQKGGLLSSSTYKHTGSISVSLWVTT